MGFSLVLPAQNSDEGEGAILVLSPSPFFVPRGLVLVGCGRPLGQGSGQGCLGT